MRTVFQEAVIVSPFALVNIFPPDVRMSIMGVHSDEFVAYCLVLANYDIRTPLATLLQRREHYSRVPFLLSHTFEELLTRLPAPGENYFRRAPMSPEEMQNTLLADVTMRMLEHDFVSSKDTDPGWHIWHNEPRRKEIHPMKALLTSLDATSPSHIKEALESIYRRPFPSLSS